MSEDPDDIEVYCKHCGGCGFIGCDGVVGFLKHHVLGKTDCLNEDMFINEIITYMGEEDTITGVKWEIPDAQREDAGTGN